MGSLAAIPLANRCSVSQADAGTCPASAQIGVISGSAESPTDGITSADGKLYLIDSAGLSPEFAAGIAAEFDTITGSVTGDLGDINARGGLELSDQSRNLTTRIDTIPHFTTTGKPFHATTVTLTVFGDTGKAVPNPNAGQPGQPATLFRPLITNPHFCNTAGEDFSARPNRAQFIGSGTGYNGSVTPDITVDYPIDNCDAVPSDQTMDYSLSSNVAGTSTLLTADETQSADDSPIRSLKTVLPSFIATNLPSFGNSEDMCGQSTSEIDASAGSQPPYFYFDPNGCTRQVTPTVSGPNNGQARVGSATITTPLLDYPIRGDVYLIDNAPVPDIGIDINPNLANPDSPTGFNPQGVTIGLVGRSSTVPCNTGENCIQAIFNSLPDVPLTSVHLELGGVSGRVGENGNALNPLPLRIANATDSVCRNTGGNVLSNINPWRDVVGQNDSVTPTGDTAPGKLNLTQSLSPTGCNDPKINITAPVVPITNGRTVNVSSTTTTSSFTFTVAGASTIPSGTTCKANNAATGVDTAAATTTVVVPLSSTSVRNTITISCTNALGTGSAQRIVDKGIPSVFISTPAASSNTTLATQNVQYGVTANGVNATSPTLPATTGLTGCTVKNLLTGTTTTSTSFTTNSVALIIGANQIQVTCTDAAGNGVSNIVTVNKTA
jgi:hypothetical protein